MLSSVSKLKNTFHLFIILLVHKQLKRLSSESLTRLKKQPKCDKIWVVNNTLKNNLIEIILTLFLCMENMPNI